MTPAEFMATWSAYEAARDKMGPQGHHPTGKGDFPSPVCSDAHVEASRRMAEAMKAARHQLGLTVNEAAEAWGVTPLQIRRLEIMPGKTAHRPVSGTMARLVMAMLAGYRPR